MRKIVTLNLTELLTKPNVTVEFRPVTLELGVVQRVADVTVYVEDVPLGEWERCQKRTFNVRVDGDKITLTHLLESAHSMSVRFMRKYVQNIGVEFKTEPAPLPQADLDKIRDQIVGEYQSKFSPEDWRYSRYDPKTWMGKMLKSGFRSSRYEASLPTGTVLAVKEDVGDLLFLHTQFSHPVRMRKEAIDKYF